MKFAMSPKRAYLLGVWKSKRGRRGVGIEGSRRLCEAFIRVCLEEGLAEPNKMLLIEENGELKGCYFYHSALRAWLERELGERERRLKYKNEFSACYFAGVFDASGGEVVFEGKPIPYIEGDKADEIILLRLGFRTKREKEKIAILSGDFYNWVSPYLLSSRK